MMLAPVMDHIHFADVLVPSLRSIENDQLTTGEIPNYRKLENGMWEYFFSPLVSAYVADALAVFDPFSHQFDPFLVEQTAGRRRLEVSGGAARIRRGIRRFLAWQQSADGAWRFLGRGSILPPDLDTTTCCALTLLDRIGAHQGARARQPDLALLRIGQTNASASRYGSREVVRMSDEIVDWIAIINLFRFTVLAGADAESLSAELERRCERHPMSSAPDIPVLYVLGLTWRQCGLAGFETVRSPYAKALAESQTPEGSFGGPAFTAMGLSALLDFGYEGPAIPSAVRWLQASMNSSPAPPEEFGDSRCGSPSLTTAIAISALARAFSCPNGSRN
jgi:hypothetical protein